MTNHVAFNWDALHEQSLANMKCLDRLNTFKRRRLNFWNQFLLAARYPNQDWQIILEWTEGTAFRARLSQLSRVQFYSEWLQIKRLQILPASRSQEIDELPPARNNIWHSTPMHPILCLSTSSSPSKIRHTILLKVLPTPSCNSLQSITFFLSVVSIHPINQRRMNVTIILRLTSLYWAIDY